MYLEDLTPLNVPTNVADGITEDLIDQLGVVRHYRCLTAGAYPYSEGTPTAR